MLYWRYKRPSGQNLVSSPFQLVLEVMSAQRQDHLLRSTFSNHLAPSDQNAFGDRALYPDLLAD